MRSVKAEPKQQIKEGLGAIMPLIGCLSSHVRYQVSKICKAADYNITPEESDTLMIIRHFDGLQQSQLASILGKDKAAVTRLMNTLVKSGLVERVQDQQDRRIIRAQITEEGKQAFVQLWPEFVKLSDHALSGISSEEANRACDVLSKINANLKALCDSQ